MPRRSILSFAERESLLALPDTKDELIRHYTFSDTDLSVIRQRRGPAIRGARQLSVRYDYAGSYRVQSVAKTHILRRSEFRAQNRNFNREFCNGRSAIGPKQPLVAQFLIFATKSPALILQGNFCRKSRVRKSDLRD